MALVLAIRPVGADSRHDGGDHPILVRDVDNPANEPLESFVCVSSGHTFTVCPASGDTFTVPLTTNSGQPVRRYVIEYVSGTCQTAPGEAIDQVFLLIPSGGFAHYFVPVNVTSNSTREIDYAFAQENRLYANPGDTLRGGAALQGAIGADYSCLVQFSGYLVKQ
jgi:hypothetical protein